MRFGRQNRTRVFGVVVRHYSFISGLKFRLFLVGLIFCQFHVISAFALLAKTVDVDLTRLATLKNAGRPVEGMRLDDWLDLVAAHNNPNFSREKLRNVYRQLLSYSGKRFKVYPFQTNLIGLAKPGGKIMIDISVIGKPIEVLAFWLAHEWAHQDLGHTRNRFATPQMTFNAFMRRKNFPTASEDEADIWAAKFLAHFGYRLEPILQYFCNLKDDFSGKNHSSWQQRAKNVTYHYNQLTGQNFAPICRSRAGYRAILAQNQYDTQKTCQSCQIALLNKSWRAVRLSYRQWCLSICRIK